MDGRISFTRYNPRNIFVFLWGACFGMSLSTTFPSVVSSVMATTSAASVSAPPQTFVAFCVFALACLALVVLAYRRYAAPGTSYYVLAATLLGWWLASLIVFVIPMVRCSKPKTKDRFLCVFPSLIFSLCVSFKKKKKKSKKKIKKIKKRTWPALLLWPVCANQNQKMLSVVHFSLILPSCPSWIQEK